MKPTRKGTRSNDVNIVMTNELDDNENMEEEQLNTTEGLLEESDQIQPGAFGVRGYLSRSSEEPSNSSSSGQNEDPVFYPVEAEIVREIIAEEVVVERGEEDIREDVMREVRTIRDEVMREVRSSNARKWRRLVFVGIVLLGAMAGIVSAVVITGGNDSKNIGASEGATTAPTVTSPTAPTVTPTTAPNDIPMPAPFPGSCFDTTAELRRSIDLYLEDNHYNTSLALTYGWPIGAWCVSNIQDFSELFSFTRNPAAIAFNEDISWWNTSSAVDMYRMFRGSNETGHSFDQNLLSWDVSSVTNMEDMFYFASAFNQALSAWDVSNVVNMNGMFGNASAFNQELASWNVSKVTDMRYMFFGARAFNQGLSSWDVSSVTNMYAMFYGSNFNQALSPWDVSNVSGMGYMFYGASSFNQDLSSWNVMSVTDMRYMFFLATSFSQNLCSWGPISFAKSTLVDLMFAATACPLQRQPNLNSTPPGPFCYSCN